MSRYIDADAFLKEYCEPYPHVYMAMSKALADAPSIDIVRCKECYMCDEEMWCSLYDSIMESDDFCSYGEREEFEQPNYYDPALWE